MIKQLKSKKIKKILRDSIFGITDKAILKLAYTAGIADMTNNSYEEIRGILKAKMENVLGKSIKYLEYYRKKTLDEYMIASSISPRMWSIDPKGKSCKSPKTPKKTSKKPRFNILNQIKFYQKRNDCLLLPIQPFTRYAREVAQDFKLDMHFTKNCMIILQYSIENFIIDILQKALKNAFHAGRTTVNSDDIKISYKYSKNDF
jgi:histone H3/H4